MEKEQQLVTHRGSCHCGAVKWEALAPAEVTALTCNCSICNKKQNTHVIVPASRFKLLQGQDNLTTYTFNTRRAKHTFCKTCGVQSFYSPRSNPDGIGIMPHCVDGDTLTKVTIRHVDGTNWETAIANDPSIAGMSKTEK